MERRFDVRLDELLADCEVDARVIQGTTQRLSEFAQVFASRLSQPSHRTHSETYLSGLLSDLERKNVESIAYLHDQDRKNLQHFIGVANWDHQPLQGELARQVGNEVGEVDGVMVIDPSAFAKKGDRSVGVARQWCGRLGKVENCQVGVYLGYVTRKQHVLVDTRLYLPKSWTGDRKRKKACGVPFRTGYRTRHELALEMICQNRRTLPHSWIAGDDEMGCSSRFRRDLNDLGENYLLAVPSDITVRDLATPPPQYSGCGRLPKQPFEQVRAWRKSLPRDAWTRVEVRDGEKGPLGIEVVKRHVQTKLAGERVGAEETLVVTRTRDERGIVKYDYYLSNAPIDTPLAEFARVATAAHRVEECIKRAKSEAGLADYEVRTWKGWHHHQVLSLIATWFLVQETERGKKTHPRPDGPPSPRCPCPAATRHLCLPHS